MRDRFIASALARRVALCSSFCLSLCLFGQANAQLFSVSAGTYSESIPGILSTQAILAPGVDAPIVRLPSFGADDVDAFSLGRSGPVLNAGDDPITVTWGNLQYSFHSLNFSVDRNSVGNPNLPAVVNTQVLSDDGLGSAHTDVFQYSQFSGQVSLLFDGNGIVSTLAGVAPELGLSEPSGATFGVDGFDSWYRNTSPASVYFSIRGAGDGAIIMISPAVTDYALRGGVPAVFALPQQIGLSSIDEIDALEIIDQGTIGVFDAADIVLFSLASDSDFLTPSASNNNTLGPRSGADIFAVQLGGVPQDFVRGVTLGLLLGDNVNAFSLEEWCAH